MSLFGWNIKATCLLYFELRAGYCSSQSTTPWIALNAKKVPAGFPAVLTPRSAERLRYNMATVTAASRQSFDSTP